MANRPLILITNDDGIDSPGLRAAAQAMADLGDLLIVAPSKQQTGAGRSYLNTADKTVHPTKLLLGQTYHPAYTANVSPAQAVNLAYLELAQRPINLCVSGINFGENVGSGVTISGTVGAALEAGCSGIPALAVSLETPHEFHMNHSDEIDFSVAAHFTRQFARLVLAGGLPPHVDLLKIDIPDDATPQTGWRMARVSRQRYYHSKPNEHIQRGDVKGFAYHVEIEADTLEPESDIYVFAVERKVAVVPMTIDLTAPVALSEIADFFNSPISSAAR